MAVLLCGMAMLVVVFAHIYQRFFIKLNLANFAVKSEENEDKLTRKADYFKGIGTVNNLFFKRQMLSVRKDDVSKEEGNR
jgi:hypothetical protein